MVDEARIRDLLQRLGREVAGLRRVGQRPADEILANDDLLDAAKYRFVVAIEVCIDVGEHIVASEGLRAPETFADVFAVLQEAGFVPPDLAPVLQQMARFRNLLVHGYGQVDDRRVVEILQTRLDDFDRFRAALAHAVLAEGEEAPGG